MASSEELKSQLFNMKMRCHEYEQRLQQVNLHGLTGERLHQRNLELADRAAAQEQEIRDLREEKEGLTQILVKSRAAIETLQASNLALKASAAELEAARAELDELRAELRAAEARERAARETRDELEQTKAALVHAREELERAAVKAAWADELERSNAKLGQDKRATEQALERKTEELRALEEELARCKLELGEALEAQQAGEARQLDAARRQKQEMELSHEARARKLERTIETQRLQLEGLDKLTKDKSAEIESQRRRADSYWQELEEVQERLARREAELANCGERERQVVDRARAEAREEGLAKIDETRRAARERDREARDKMARMQDENQSLREANDKLREALRGKDDMYKEKLAAMAQEIQQVKAKWKSSITAKKKKPLGSSKENVSSSRANTGPGPRGGTGGASSATGAASRAGAIAVSSKYRTARSGATGLSSRTGTTGGKKTAR